MNKLQKLVISVLRCPACHCQCGKGGGAKLAELYHREGAELVYRGVCPRDKGRVIEIDLSPKASPK